VERKDWYWYDTLDLIFGTRENIAPSFVANKSTNIIIEEEVEIKKKSYKKPKVKNNVEAMTIAIAEMNQTRERIHEQKMILERKKVNKNYELEKERLEIEKERRAHEREREIEREKMEFQYKMKELELKYQKKD